MLCFLLCLSSFCVLFSMLSVSLYCPFLIARLVSSNDYKVNIRIYLSFFNFPLCSIYAMSCLSFFSVLFISRSADLSLRTQLQLSIMVICFIWKYKLFYGNNKIAFDEFMLLNFWFLCSIVCCVFRHSCLLPLYCLFVFEILWLLITPWYLQSFLLQDNSVVVETVRRELFNMYVYLIDQLIHSNDYYLHVLMSLS